MMKWKVQLIGESFDLQELEKSFSGYNNFTIAKDKNEYYLISIEFESCHSSNEVKSKALDILDVLNGVKTLALGGNRPIELGHIVREKSDGTREVFVEVSDTITIRDSVSIIKKTSKGEIIEEVHPADDVPKWLSIGLRDENIKRALRIYGKERHTWAGLYKVYEIIEDAVGGKQKIIEKNGQQKMPSIDLNILPIVPLQLVMKQDMEQRKNVVPRIQCTYLKHVF